MLCRRLSGTAQPDARWHSDACNLLMFYYDDRRKSMSSVFIQGLYSSHYLDAPLLQRRDSSAGNARNS
eukprot:3504626-Pleurochrysis_carterae.AAC.2